MTGDLAVRTQHRLRADARRVITKLFVPGEETPHGQSRAYGVIVRILALPEAEVQAMADTVVADYRQRHRDLAQTFADHFAVVAQEIPEGVELSAARRLLIGACFTHEYSPEAAALFNPSMAAHPDQSGLAPGQLRFVMTVRCVGEGHLSSIGFRTGVLGPGHALVVDDPGPLLVTGTARSRDYQLSLFHAKLTDLGDDSENAHLLLSGLAETFTAKELGDALGLVHEHSLNRERMRGTVEHVHQIAAATYDLDFPTDTSIPERLLWPTAPAEWHGMEDARLVQFHRDDGTSTYYATYTAFDGIRVAPSLLETTDFRQFHVSPLAGQGARNKGLALFPRQVGGEYLALSRWDRETVSLVRSADCRIWSEPADLYDPSLGWELIQVGNCGSPVETPDGWLVLTHGVGPMRAYSLGALLLDLDDPSIVVANLASPLLSPNADERDGYVPNVVYSCGPLLHDGVLTIPYGISDGAIGFAQIELSVLLSQLRPVLRPTA